MSYIWFVFKYIFTLTKFVVFENASSIPGNLTILFQLKSMYILFIIFNPLAPFHRELVSLMSHYLKYKDILIKGLLICENKFPKFSKSESFGLS
jgi:hypothetical protein